MILSLLICSFSERKEFLMRMLDQLNLQLFGRQDVEIKVCNIEGSSIGKKRNILLQEATGKYVAYLDDDDVIAPDYIKLIMSAIESDPDCCSLKGILTTNGVDARIFIHSIKYDSYFEQDGIYYRPPNHLNVIRASVAKRFSFPEINHGEDTDWAMQISRSGLLQKETVIKSILYYYIFIPNK